MGAMEMLETPDPVLAFMRTSGAERIACLFNMGAEAVDLAGARLANAELLDAGTGTIDHSQGAWRLGPYAARFLRLS